MGGWLTRFTDGMNSFLAKLPSTNFRIFYTMHLVGFTTLRYLVGGVSLGPASFGPWYPSSEWLIFLAAMAGIDVAQFLAKRATHQESPPAGADVEDAKALSQTPAPAQPREPGPAE